LPARAATLRGRIRIINITADDLVEMEIHDGNGRLRAPRTCSPAAARSARTLHCSGTCVTPMH